MATILPNATAPVQVEINQHHSTFSIVLVVGVVCGVLTGLLLGWAAMEATSQARSRCIVWSRKKLGSNKKEETSAQMTSSDSAVWSAQEGGDLTPKPAKKSTQALPSSTQETLVVTTSPSAIIAYYISGDNLSQKDSRSTPETPRKQKCLASAASPYSYYDVDDLSTPKARVPGSLAQNSLDESISEVTPTKATQWGDRDLPNVILAKRV